jgi:hypothetical protein
LTISFLVMILLQSESVTLKREEARDYEWQVNGNISRSSGSSQPISSLAR